MYGLSSSLCIRKLIVLKGFTQLNLADFETYKAIEYLVEVDSKLVEKKINEIRTDKERSRREQEEKKEKRKKTYEKRIQKNDWFENFILEIRLG